MASTKQAILQVLRPEPAYMTAKAVYEAVRTFQPTVVEATVRNELAIMVSSDEYPVVSVRRGFYAKNSLSFERDVDMVARSLQSLLNGVTAAGISVTPDGYRSPALALIDCIFSARAQYSSVTALIARVCTKLGITDADEVGISEFVHLVENQARGVDDIPFWLANTFFENRSYATKDLFKAVQVFLVAKRLCTLAEANPVLWNLDTKGDFDRISTLSSDDAAEFLNALEVELTRLRGWGPALHRYLLLLLKVSMVAKPDTRIIEFISQSLGRSRSSIETRYAAFVFEDAVRRLNEQGVPYNVIEADHTVWRFMRGDFHVDFESAPVTTGVEPVKPASVPNASQLASTSVSLEIGDKVTPKFGSSARIGEVVGHDSEDPLRVIVKWKSQNGTTSFNVERKSTLQLWREEIQKPHSDASIEGPKNKVDQRTPGEADLLTRVFEGMKGKTKIIERSGVVSARAISNLDNHGKLEHALAPHRGKQLNTQEMWAIVDAVWQGQFAKGSFLPNDHADGNKGSCWCAVNRQNRPLLRRIERGVYLVL